MLQNAYLVAKVGADTAENEQHFAEILPKTSLKCTASRVRTEVSTGPPAAARVVRVHLVARRVPYALLPHPRSGHAEMLFSEAKMNLSVANV